MPKKIEPEIRERVMRMIAEHHQEYVTPTETVDDQGRRKLTPEGLYGRCKKAALLRRTAMPGVSAVAVDRAMRTLGLSGVRRDKGTRTTIPAKDGKRAGDPLDRVFTAPKRRTGSGSPTSPM